MSGKNEHLFPTTKFERVSVITVRVLELKAGGTPHPLVKATPDMDFQIIATLEYEAGLLKYASKLTYPADADDNVRVVEKIVGPTNR